MACGAAPGFSVLWIRSFALSCVSVSSKRTRMPLGSNTAPVYEMFACLRTSCSFCSSAGSTFTVCFALEICTAGDSPKKFGSV